MTHTFLEELTMPRIKIQSNAFNRLAVLDGENKGDAKQNNSKKTTTI
jgi:hypothetical protein